MNDDLISRQAAIDTYLETVEPIAVQEWDGEISACARDRDILEMLENLPSVQPKTGCWAGTVCTACGTSTSYYYDCNYCPICGAKMEGDGE